MNGIRLSNVPRRVRIVRTLSLMVLVGSALIVTTCSDKVPTKPDPPPEQVVYMWDGGQENRYFACKPATNELDSFAIDFNPSYGLCVSPDGQRLYGAGDDGVAVIDLTTRTLIRVLPYLAYDGVLASPDGHTLAVGSDSLLILSTVDYSVLFHQPLFLGAAAFSRDGKKLYSITKDSITTINLSGGMSAKSRSNEFGYVGRLRLSPDESRWYLYRSHGLYTFSFAVYDIALDSMVFVLGLTPGAGDLEVTPDGGYVFFTSPGGLMFGPPPQYTFASYNTQTGQVTFFKFNSECTAARDFYPMGELSVTPDGRWLTAVSGPCGGHVISFDIPNMAMTSFTCTGNDKCFMHLISREIIK